MGEENRRAIELSRDNIKKRLNDMGSCYLMQIEYNGKKYVQAFKRKSFENVYYELENDLVEVNDINTIQHLKDYYESKESDFVD